MNVLVLNVKIFFDYTNGDIDERLCNKCLETIYDENAKVEQTNGLVK